MLRLTVKFQNPCECCIHKKDCHTCAIRKKWLEKYQLYTLECMIPTYSDAFEVAMQYIHALADSGISPYGTDWLLNDKVLVHGVVVTVSHVPERLRDNISQALEGLRQLREAGDFDDE